MQLQGKARALVLCLFPELKGNGEQVSSILSKTLSVLHLGRAGYSGHCASTEGVPLCVQVLDIRRNSSMERVVIPTTDLELDDP